MTSIMPLGNAARNENAADWLKLDELHVESAPVGSQYLLVSLRPIQITYECHCNAHQDYELKFYVLNDANHGPQKYYASPNPERNSCLEANQCSIHIPRTMCIITEAHALVCQLVMLSA
jgi:hypothetical protein